MKKSIFSFLCVLFVTFSVYGKSLDKVVAIVNDNVITKSQVERIQSTIFFKRNINNISYTKNNYSFNEIVDLTINKYLIRAKLNEIGYSITDDQVESQIKANEKRLGVDRKSLLKFLSDQNTTFDEYFETLREAIEQNVFTSRVISPLISISEQDVKNSYFKKNAKSKTVAFKYQLVDFLLPKAIATNNKTEILDAIKSFRNTGIWSQKFSQISVTNLDDVGEDSLSNELKSALQTTDEGSLTGIINISDLGHVFFVKKKDLVESEQFLKEKDKTYNELFDQAVAQESQLWLNRERNKHYIKTFL